MDIQNSDIVYGGFKIAGADDGGYVFRVSPTGDVEIGGNGSGGTDLIVKQNLTLSGGFLTVKQLAISDAGTPTLAENADQGSANDTGCSDATAYYYKITALNDNGETTGSTEATITLGAASGTYTNDDTITIEWTAVVGATKYKIHRSVDQTWDAGANDYWVDKKFITSPNVTHIDNCQTAGDTASDAPPSANTTGGRIAINTTVDGTDDRRLEVLDASDPQMRLTYDASNRAEFQVSGTGILTVTTAGSGTDIIVADDNFKICFGGACPSLTMSATGNLLVENKIYTNGDNENMPRHSCPTGWVLVPGSAAFGTEDFCVMKYEAKQNSSTKNPESVAAGTPWVSISQYEAKSACTRIGAHLINEAEWMTIARNVEVTTINDMDDDASLQLATGHSDNAPANSLAAASGADPVITTCALTSIMENASNAYSAGNCEIQGTGAGGSTDNDKGYYGTGQQWSATGYVSGVANKSQLRTHILSNRNVIWDISGNVWEWTDAQCDTTSWYNIAAWAEWSDANLTNYEGIVGGSTAYTSANGVGQYYGCTANGNAFLRGGSWSSGANAGAFALYLSNAPSASNTNVGFRCVR